MIDLKTVLSDKDKYLDVYDKYYNKCLEKFDNRKKVLTLKFPSGEEEKMKINKFLVNMIFWLPFVEFNREVTKDWIFDAANVSSDMIANQLDLIIEEFDSEDNMELNYCLAEIIKQLGFFSLDFNRKIGNTISLYNLTRLAKENKEFNDLIHTRYNENLNTGEIEDDLKSKTSSILKILGTWKNCLQDYVNSKEGLNKNQLTQLLINVGPKPDLKGNVYPKIVDTNFITDGMQSVSDYYINSSGGRKAAITNHSKTKQSGYLMRKLSILCMNVELSDKIKDCGSTNYIKVLMDSEDTMRRFDKRYYVDSKGKLRLFRFRKMIEKKDKILGREFLFRSPMTCACKGNCVCQTCYGTLSKLNFDIHIGILAIEILTSQVTQKMLSSKHLLKTSTKHIEWDEHFTELFNVNGNVLQLNDSIDELNRYTLLIDEDNIQDNEEGIDGGYDEDDEDDEGYDDDGLLSNVTKYFRSCVLRKKINKMPGRKYTADYEYFPITLNTDLYMSPYFEGILKKSVLTDDGIYEVQIKDLQQDNPIFYIEIENEELSAVLSNILSLIEKKERLGCETYDEMINTFIGLCNESGIVINSVHNELIIRELIKDSENILKRPDFTTQNPPYQLLTLSNSILNSNSVVTSISFERFKEQIYKARTYRKNGKSLFDNFFM